MQKPQEDTTTATKKRRTRSDTGPRITERDLAALRWIAQQYAISQDHLAILLARLAPEEAPEADHLTEKRTAEIVRRWQELKLVEKGRILHNGPAWVWLTGEGLRLISEELGSFRPYTPNPAKLNHLFWCNHARLFVEGRKQDTTWTSERELAAGNHIERGQKRPHLPDAVVITNQHSVAIEVELSPKTYPRLDTILHELARSGYNAVWYLTRGRSTAVMKGAIGAMHQMYQSKFIVYNLDEMPLQ